MSTNPENSDRKPMDYGALLGGSALSSNSITDSVKVAESIQTMRFVFHAWADINNGGINVVGRGGVHKYPTIPRLALVPLYAWPVSNIKPKPGPSRFALGVSPIAGIFQTAVGSENKPRMQSALEHEAFLLGAYEHFGIVSMESCITETDGGKVQAALLFAAIMRSIRPAESAEEGEEEIAGSAIKGEDVVLEQLAQWLALEAPQNLDYAIANGVDYEADSLFPGLPSGHYPLQPSLRTQGIKMIAEMLVGVNKAVNRAINKSNGVLVVTRGQLKQAEAGQEGAKMRLDPLDEWLVEQFPTFSMDTAVERAQSANRELVRAFQGKRDDSAGDQDRELLRMALAQNNELITQVRELTALVQRNMPAPPPDNPGGPSGGGGPATGGPTATEGDKTGQPATTEATKPGRGGNRGQARTGTEG